MANPGRRLLWLAVLLGGAAVASRAGADGVSVTANPGYTTSTSTLKDETGRATTIDTQSVAQRYRMTLDDSIYPSLVLSAGGSIDWTDSWNRSEGLTLRSDDKLWNAYARLRWGNPFFGGGFDYDRRWEQAYSTTAGVRQPVPGVIREAYSSAVGLHPADLPTVDLRVGRTDTYDSLRVIQDLTVNDVQVSTRYDPSKKVETRYAVRYSGLEDHLHDFQTRTVENSLAATWTDSFLGGRGTAYVGYNLGTRNTQVSAAPTSTGQIFTPQLPTGGLSKVEVFPETADKVTLVPNAKLVDGVTTSTAGVSASAGLNIGTSGDVVTDRAVRDIGAQFANAVTPVSEIDVWVDQQLPQDLATNGFTWAVFQSDDNVTWTPVSKLGAVQFDLFTPRFKIPIVRTSARYLKVSTRPLSVALTTDPKFAEISVTEIQFFDVTSVENARGRTFNLSGSLTGTARVALVRSLGLAYDSSILVTHTNSGGGVTWSAVNGLSGTQRLSRVWSASERVERSDSDFGAGHESSDRWSLSLGADPLPTLGALLNYGGQVTQRARGTLVSNTVTGTLRTDLYEGISASANTSVGVVRNEVGRLSRALTQAGSLSLVPNRVVQITGTVSYTYNLSEGGGQSAVTTREGFAEAAVSLAPFPALALSGNVLRYFSGGTPSTLASFSGGFSPFPGGDLQLRYAYSETLETLTNTRARTHGPGARWNIRPGWYLEGAFSWNRTTSAVQEQIGRVGNVNLFIALR